MPKYRQGAGSGHGAYAATGADRKRRGSQPVAADRGASNAHKRIDGGGGGSSGCIGAPSRPQAARSSARSFSSPTAYSIYAALLFLVGAFLRFLKAPWAMYRRVRWLQKRISALSHAGSSAGAASGVISPVPPTPSAVPPTALKPIAPTAPSTPVKAATPARRPRNPGVRAANCASRGGSYPVAPASGEVETPPPAPSGVETSPTGVSRADREPSPRPSFSASKPPSLMSDSSSDEPEDSPEQRDAGCGGGLSSAGWRRGNFLGALAAAGMGAVESSFRRVVRTSSRKRSRSFEGNLQSEASDCDISSVLEADEPSTARRPSPSFRPSSSSSDTERSGGLRAARSNEPEVKCNSGVSAMRDVSDASLNVSAAGSVPLSMDVASTASRAEVQPNQVLPPPPTRIVNTPSDLAAGLSRASLAGGQMGGPGDGGHLPNHAMRTKAENRRQAAIRAAMLITTHGGLLKPGGQSRRGSRRQGAAGGASSNLAHDLQAAEAHAKFLASAELGLNLLAEAGPGRGAFDQLKADIVAARLIAEEDCERIRQEAAKIRKAEKRQRRKAATDRPEAADSSASTSAGGGAQGRTASDERTLRRSSNENTAEQRTMEEAPGPSSARQRAVAAATAVVAARNTRAGHLAAGPAAAQRGGAAGSGRRGRLAGGASWATGSACPESGVGICRRRRPDGSGARATLGANTFNYLADGATGDNEEGTESGVGPQEGLTEGALEQGQQQIQYEIGDYDPDAVCVVCMDAECTALLQPCLHVVMCVWCAIKNKEKSGLCPVCRAPIEELYNLEG